MALRKRGSYKVVRSIMLFKRAIALITVIISVIFVVSLGGCFWGDGETESETVFMVIFDSAGGTKVESVTVKSGEKIPEPPEPKKSNTKQQYVFKGWYIGDSKWDFKNEIVTGDITLTAKWELTGDFTVGF